MVETSPVETLMIAFPADFCQLYLYSELMDIHVQLMNAAIEEGMNVAFFVGPNKSLISPCIAGFQELGIDVENNPKITLISEFPIDSYS